MKRLLQRFLRLGTLQPVPAGMVADKSADFGLIALMSNANAYSQMYASSTTSGTSVDVTAALALAGVLELTSGASGGFTINLPATSVLLSALGRTIPTDGSFCKRISIVNNNVGQTGTLTAGDASTTVSGTATIATDTTRTFLLRVTSATTITITNIGSMSL